MLYERVKQLCTQNNVTIAGLEKKLNFGNGTISNWDKVNPSIEKVKKVARYFEMSIDELLNDSELTTEAKEIAKLYDSYSDEKKNLIKCYMSLIEK